MGDERRRAATAGFALAVLAGAALVSFRATYEPDLWWHLAQGREVASGHLVRTNLFSFTYPDYPQPYTPWLFDLGSYVLWTRAGPMALQVAQALAIVLTFWAVAAACRIRSSLAAAAAVCFFGWLIIEPRALPRPHVLSFLGLGLCVYMVERARFVRHSRPLRWAPLLIAAWANVHVECVFGVAVVGLFGAGESLQPRSLPRGEATFVPQIINIAELLPPYLPNYRGFFVWSIGVALALLLQGRRVSLGDMLILAPFAYLAFSHLRMTPLLFLLSAPIVARAVDDLQRFGIDRRAIATTAAAATIFLARVPITGMVGELGAGRAALMPPEFFSEPAMQFARDHQLAGLVFTSMNLGGFVAWELYPSARVFVDSRLQAYPPAHFRAIIEASKDPQMWAAITAGVDWAVVSVPRVNELSGVGHFNPPEWRSVFRDSAVEIFVRQSRPD